MSTGRCLSRLVGNVKRASIATTRGGLSSINTVASRLTSLDCADSPSPSGDGCVRPIHTATNGSTGRARCAIGAIIRHYFHTDNRVSYGATSRLNVSHDSTADCATGASADTATSVLSPNGAMSNTFAFNTRACVPVVHIIINIA